MASGAQMKCMTTHEGYHNCYVINLLRLWSLTRHDLVKTEVHELHRRDKVRSIVVRVVLLRMLTVNECAYVRGRTLYIKIYGQTVFTANYARVSCSVS